MADDALRCAACGSESKVTDTEADPDAELACVELVRSSSEYEVVASLLEAEGIPVALHNHVGFALRGLADGPFTWDPTYDAVRVMVPKAFEQAARELIAAQVPPDAEADAEESGPQAS
jgi:hypothetical protein